MPVNLARCLHNTVAGAAGLSRCDKTLTVTCGLSSRIIRLVKTGALPPTVRPPGYGRACGEFTIAYAPGRHARGID